MTATLPIDPTTTLAEVVTGHPALARDLERIGLDYCCGGQRTIAEAAAPLGLDVEAVVAQLTAEAAVSSAGAADWAGMDAAALVDHLEATHHRYLHAELPRLTDLLDKIVGVHGGRHPELTAIRATYGELRGELEPHLRKEEVVLFPMIRELATSERPPAFHCGSLRNPISVMLREHDRAGELLAQLREQTDGYQPPADGCASYQAAFAGLAELEADTHLHVHKENNLLFPAVERLEDALAAATP